MTTHETVEAAEAFKRTYESLKANPGKLADLLIAAIALPIETADRNIMLDYLSDMLGDCYGQKCLEAETIMEEADRDDKRTRRFELGSITI